MVKSKSEMLVIHGKNASLLKGRIMENRKKIFRKRVESESFVIKKKQINQLTLHIVATNLVKFYFHLASVSSFHLMMNVGKICVISRLFFFLGLISYEEVH